MKNQRTRGDRFDAPLDGLYHQMLKRACRENGSPYAIKIWLLLTYSNADDLLSESSIDPLNYEHQVMEYLKDAQLCALIKKYPSHDVSVDATSVAKKKFIDAEIKCWETNNRLRYDPLLENEGDDVYAIMRLTRQKIGSILGRCPSPEHLSFEFGPGANYNVSNVTDSYHKLNSSLDLTTNSIGTAMRFLSSCPGWLHSIGICPTSEADLFDQLNLIPGCRLSFVPKNATTDRPIGIEPLLNGLIQKGIGKSIRARLKVKGLDLKSAQFAHRNMARLASKDACYATVDLQAASDTISHGIVRNLLPWDWYQLLNSVRSPSYTIEGKVYDFHKFSSMGNGYTFELESLIFLALTRAVQEYSGVKSQCSVYGDDIIIANQCSKLLYKCLKAFGFTVNEEKSFTTGSFRESCGGDFLHGVDVRPFSLKSELSPRVLLLILNSWTRSGIKHLYPKVWALLKRSLPRWLVTMQGPEDGTDGHLLDISYPTGKPYRTVKAQPILLKMNRLDNRMYKAFALYRQMFSSFPLITGVYHALEPFLGSNTCETIWLREATDRFRGHSQRRRFRYKVKRINTV